MPAAVRFATKPQLAKAMLARAFAAGTPAAWVAAAAVYGADGRFRQWLEAVGRAYVLAVPHTHRVWLPEGQAAAKRVVAQLPAARGHAGTTGRRCPSSTRTRRGRSRWRTGCWPGAA